MRKRRFTFMDHQGWGSKIEQLYEIYYRFELPFGEKIKGDFIIDCIFGGLKRQDLETWNGIVTETKTDDGLSIKIKDLTFNHSTNISRFFRYCTNNNILDVNPDYDEMGNCIVDNEYRLTTKHQRELKLSEILD